MKDVTKISEKKQLFKEIMHQPERMLDLLQVDLKMTFEKAITELMKTELTNFLDRDKYERISKTSQPNGINYRNGYYERKYTVRNTGEMNLSVPRDRLGKYSSNMLKKYERYDKRIEKDLVLLFLTGLSTRNISLISHNLIGRRLSSTEVSNANKELLSGIDNWRTRSLSDTEVKYLYIDGVNFGMRVGHSIEKLPMLVVIGVKKDNRKIFLTIQRGDKESASTWREIFKDMKSRGLNHKQVKLGIMDGLTGLEKVFCEEFTQAKVQRCQVHVARNVMCKTPKKLKTKVADSLRDIFYAPDRKRAYEMYSSFVEKYEAVIPSAVKSLSNSIHSTLTFYSLPKEEWTCLRTTNAIERVNKEFKRRTKPMEILAGENSAYRLLCFIAFKMELHWRTTPVGRKNLPNAFDKFTQLT